ncbi:hypothetical protein GCM10023238_37430 [Streptomyces heliomycini]
MVSLSGPEPGRLLHLGPGAAQRHLALAPVWTSVTTATGTRRLRPNNPHPGVDDEVPHAVVVGLPVHMADGAVARDDGVVREVLLLDLVQAWRVRPDAVDGHCSLPPR